MSTSRDDDYLEWKGWSANRFGQLTPADRAYFQSEFTGNNAVRPGLRVLEVGFGNGSFLAYAKDLGATVAGIELNEILVSNAKDKGFSVFHFSEVNKLEKNAWDLIVAIDVIEHVPVTEVDTFLGLLASLMTENGRIFFRFPNGDSWLGNPYQNGDVTHANVIGYHKLVQMCGASALEIESFRGDRRRGFATSFSHGLHKLLTGPLRYLIGLLLKAIYFPNSHFVLSSSNVVAVVRRGSANVSSMIEK